MKDLKQNFTQKMFFEAFLLVKNAKQFDCLV